MFKSFSYDIDHPEEVTYHIGKMTQFVARPNGQPEQPEELTEEQRTFRQQLGEFWRVAKPELAKLAKEVWYSKEQLRKMQAGEVSKPEPRIVGGSVKIGVEKKDSA